MHLQHSQRQLLYLLQRYPDLTSEQVCAHLDRPRRAVQAALQRLKQAGLVEEQRDGDDLRKFLYRLTLSGKVTCERGRG